PFAKAINLHRLPRRSGHPSAILARQRRSIRHPEIARPALQNLELDRLRPNLLLPLHVIENAAVPSLPLAASIRSLSPLELPAQVKILIRLLRNDVAELLTRDMDH